ncbi:MAG: insulinase family protein, partial [bacterium]|nr:insulinase family protein [bacterium]
YMVFKINFLPDKLQLFARFLKNLYTYKPFLNIKINPDSYTYIKRERDSSRKVKISVDDYWQHFFKQENWKRDIAYQIAYSKLFPESTLGNTLVTANALRQATLSKIRVFYQRTFRLPNSLLIIKGNLRPHLIRAYINGEFASFKKQVPEVPVAEELTVKNQRRLVVFNNPHPEPPILFWFEAIAPLNHEDHIPYLVLNNILFGFPIGRIYLTSRDKNLKNLNIKSEVTNQKEISVVCNTVQLRSRDIQRFIYLADREKKKLTVKKVERKEYLDTLSYFNGRIKVATRHIDNDINHEILTAFYPFKKGDFLVPTAQPPQYKLAVLNKRIEDSKFDSGSPKGVIVIVANYNMVRRYLKDIKHV